MALKWSMLLLRDGDFDEGVDNGVHLDGLGSGIVIEKNESPGFRESRPVR